MRMQMSTKRNVMLYLDMELVKKTRELGFNLSKTFENYMKHLIKGFPYINSENKVENRLFGSPGEIRTLVSGSRARHAWPLHHRALTRNTWILCNIFNVKVPKEREQTFSYFLLFHGIFIVVSLMVGGSIFTAP
jgi:hypothetical protein